jgi:hypothetical protein
MNQTVNITCRDLDLRINRKYLDIVQVYEPDRFQCLPSILMIAKEINDGTIRGGRCTLKMLFNAIIGVEGQHIHQVLVRGFALSRFFPKGRCSADFIQDLFACYHMDAVYLNERVFRCLRHEYHMKEFLISKAFDSRDALCKECLCKGAQFGHINRPIKPFDLSEEHTTPVKGLRDDIPFRPFTVPKAAGRLPVAHLFEPRMPGSAQGDPLTAQFLPYNVMGDILHIFTLIVRHS